MMSNSRCSTEHPKVWVVNLEIEKFVGLNFSVKFGLLRLAFISLCGPIRGQSLILLIVNQPKRQRVLSAWPAAKKTVCKDLTTYKCPYLTSHLKIWKLPYLESAMYCSWKFGFSETIAVAKKRNIIHHAFYDEQLLLNTQICTVPRSYFLKRKAHTKCVKHINLKWSSYISVSWAI